MTVITLAARVLNERSCLIPAALWEALLGAGSRCCKDRRRLFNWPLAARLQKSWELFSRGVFGGLSKVSGCRCLFKSVQTRLEKCSDVGNRTWLFNFAMELLNPHRGGSNCGLNEP